MILSLAFVNGFQKVVSEKVFSFWGHVRIQHLEPFKVSIAEETPIQKNDTIEQAVRAMVNVKHIESYNTKSAIINAHSTIAGILFKGVGRNYTFNELQPFLKQGRWPDYSDSGFSPEIVISQPVADEIGLKLNDPLLIYFIQPGEERPRTRKLKVCGIFKTGIDLYDKNFAIGDMRLIQKLNGWDSTQIGGYEVVLHDYSKMDTTSATIYQQLPAGWDSKTMREVYPDIFDWLNLQDTNKVILLSVMTVVAVINLITCLIILVLERTRMIGVLKSLGATDGAIQRIFMQYGIIITAAGILGGMVLGLGICWLQIRTGFIRLNEEAYYMDRAPIEIVWWQVAAVAVGTFLVCFSVLFIPAIISRRISPAKAVQFR